MHGPYPGELRTRVIDFVEEGGSRRGAAEQFDVSVSSAIRWVQRFRENGTFEPMPSGGSSSPLEKHSRQILALISAQPTLRWMKSFRRFTSGESQAAAAHCPDSSLAIASPLKKVCGRQSGSAPTSPARADAGFGARLS